MMIRNYRELATTELRGKVLDIVAAGISRVLPSTIIKSAVKYNPLRRILTVNSDKYHVTGRIFVIGGGKASALMARTLEKILPPEIIAAGIVNSKSGDGTAGKIKIIQAGHPVPDERGLKGVEEMLSLKDRFTVNERDLVICLISGGGSALMPYPAEGISLQDKAAVTGLLLASGADIHEINTVRKHLSKIKGGGLGQYFAPATVITLILSDVIGNDLDVIASGQTCPDPSTFAQALDVLKKYGLVADSPRNVIEYLTRGCRGEVGETPKILPNCHNYLIGDNTLALEAMDLKARNSGFHSCVVTAEQSGNTTGVALLRATEILSGKYDDYDLLLIGGETTPKLPANPGKGGRNQHYAAVSMLGMADFKGEWVVASVGTDGSDYLPEVAGAIVSNHSLGEVLSRKIDAKSYIERYDSHTLLKIIGNSLIITGNTETNVGDVIVYALKRSIG